MKHLLLALLAMLLAPIALAQSIGLGYSAQSVIGLKRKRQFECITIVIQQLIAMTDTYLRSLGFAPTARAPHGSQATFANAWRYQYDYTAVDGSRLFIEHPLGIATCRLSTVEAPLADQDVFAHVGLHDRPALEAAIKAFYAAHGGMGALVQLVPASTFLPYRRQL